MVFQAGIQTKIREGGLSGKIQLRSYEGLIIMGLGEGLWKIFENVNWETCSNGPCETQ